MNDLTDRQKQILKYIEVYQEQNFRPPTFREIGKNFDITVKAVDDHVIALEKKEAIRRLPGSRGIVVKARYKKDPFEKWLDHLLIENPLNRGLLLKIKIQYVKFKSQS